MQSNASQNEDSLAANALNPLLQSLGFTTAIKHKMQGKSEIDLVLTKDSAISVIIEAKKPHSKEMPSADNPNAKALYEAILYYFRERENGNLGIKNIVITDFYRFFIIKSRSFESAFYENPAFKKLYENFTAPNSHFKGNTDEFYREAKRILDFGEISLNYFYFDLERIFGENDFSFPSIKPIFKALHKDFLIDEFSPNDANILNEKFYRELLYILGLDEYKEGNKIVIKPSSESKKGANTLYNAILGKLPSENCDFDFAMQFVILWLNRILFLKLVEANLVRFNNDKNLAFLNLSKVADFKTLSNLFFEILAKMPDERKDSPLSFLPYLNSNLFERHECEEMLDISALDDNAKLAYFNETQLKDKHTKKKQGDTKLLAYIFEFLGAFDFGSDESSNELATQNELISSSVLGLVFEKLNGYKEGSFFTPSFITGYMCKESLEKVVLQKFGDLGLNAPNLAVLKSQILMNVNADFAFRDKALGVLKSIKICDPAVGSGHFLVSALCEMVRIYRELGLVEDALNACEIAVHNDEVHISQNGKVFAYQKPRVSNENHAIQKALFNLKKSIIENNLFGVDINPNSVEICKLRLWIELLKNSYYLVDSADGFDANLSDKIHQMQTLPNIDINIKCGNSLLSRFRLNDSLPTTQNIKNQISEYKKLVFDYKNADSAILKPNKKDIEKKIDNLKATFRLTLKDLKTKRELEKAIKNHTALYGLFMLDDESLLDGLDCGISNTFMSANLSETEQKEAIISFANIKFLRHKLDSNGNGYKNAFEWRFEFPEVLNENGDFMGFDLVIGNPPYVVKKKDEYPQYQWNSDLYTMFFEMGFKIATPNYYVHFITPRFWLVNESLESMRKYFLQNINLLSLSESNPFTRAKTENVISEIQLCAPKQNTIKHCKETDEIFYFVDNIDKEIFALNAKCEIVFNVDKPTIALFDKICKNKITLKNIMQTKRGAEYGKDFIKKFRKGIKILLGGEVKAYSIEWDKSFVDSELKDIKRLSEFFKQKDLIYLRRVDKRLSASIGGESYAFTKNIYGIKITDKKYNPKFILGLLNSKLLNFYYLRRFTTKKEEIFPEIQTYLYEQLPIPKLNAKNKKIADKVANLVDKILESKSKDADSTTLESQVDDLVYQLYELSDSEKAIIKNGE